MCLTTKDLVHIFVLVNVLGIQLNFMYIRTYCIILELQGFDFYSSKEDDSCDDSVVIYKARNGFDL